MRARFFVWLLVVIFVIPAVAPAALAQESDPLTCDEGPNDALNAAQAARDAGELAQALELAVQAEALCADSVIRYTQALTLRTEIERLIEQQEREEFRAAVMPGLVDLGDYALFMRCEGAGSPTIIFENGFDNSLDTWDPVREQAAAMTRTCVYDHLGVGYSDVVADIRQRTTQDQVDDLHQLLALAGIAPPYVFVGHSNGGYNQLLYTHNFPDEVLGHVMIDTYHPEFVKPYFTAGQTIGAERLDRYTSSLQVEQVTSLGDRPLVVIAANHPDNETAYPGEVWMPLQEEFATYSTNSRYIVTDSSAHDIQRYDPDLVIEAIRWVLDEAAPPVTRDLLFGSDLDGDMDIYRLVMETGEWQALTDTAVDEYMPNWSPNGQYIAFDRLIGGAPIVHRINVDGSDERRLVDVSGQNGWMGWSPDGSQIVFYSTREGSAKLFVMDADGGNPHRISDIVPGYEPNWSPDGTQIVFMSHSFGVGDIFVLTLADGHIEQLTDNGSVSDWDPDWSPDGTQIAFTSDLAGHGNNDIYVMDADGSNLRRLTFHDADDEFPAWSPDGTQIAFCSQRDGRDWDIFVVQADGSYLQQITDTPYDEWGVDWQP